MKIHALPLQGAFHIEAELIEDDRGFFTRLFDRELFESLGLETRVEQASMSSNRARGTLRGMHWQVEPYAEVKLIRVTAGIIHDVIVDLRPASPTYLQHISIELSARSPALLYIPAGFAHGFQTLEDNTEVYYHMNRIFHPPAARGFLWSDPQFAIHWPLPNPILSPRDMAASHFTSDLLVPL